MKNLLIYFSVIICLLYSCDKDLKKSNTTGPVTDSLNDSTVLIGKWNIISEYIAVTIGPEMVKNQSTYIGVPSDYYNFQPNGTIFIKEGNKTDTFTYKLLSGSQIIINNPAAGTYFIKNLTEHTLMLISRWETYSYWPTPGGPLYDSISLQR